MNITKYLAKHLFHAVITMTLAAFCLLTSESWAQEKGGERLQKFGAVKTVEDLHNLEPGDTMAMACPKCKDVTIWVVDKSIKGAQKDPKAIQQHMCPGCAEVFTTVGMGKAKTDVVKHVCKKCGSTEAFCCVKKKGAKATEGMGEK